MANLIQNIVGMASISNIMQEYLAMCGLIVTTLLILWFIDIVVRMFSNWWK